MLGKDLVQDVVGSDVLWSCTTCGACVEQCPVDIEHVDTIMELRRYEVLMESRFPAEAGTMLRNVENSGDPWGLGAGQRLAWTEGLDFEVPVVGDRIPDDVEYLYWVGCAAASRTGPARRPGPSPACCTGPGCASPCSARASPAPATRPAGSATSTSTSSRPSRTSRPSTASGRAR